MFRIIYCLPFENVFCSVVDVVNWKLTFDFYFATKYRDAAMNDDTR